MKSDNVHMEVVQIDYLLGENLYIVKPQLNASVRGSPDCGDHNLRVHFCHFQFASELKPSCLKKKTAQVPKWWS